MAYLYKVNSITRRDGIRNETVRKELDIQPTATKIKEQQELNENYLDRHLYFCVKFTEPLGNDRSSPLQHLFI